ncbi:MAG TPA: lysylphosphatidylglycerol synthase transmembrane domain-containing protein [Thermoleophilaceae bacterium]|nr:lysylphosphatidylglycerol synthase transmembrane domain-containing protein [Thermoleophilaceae bacterium]
MSSPDGAEDGRGPATAAVDDDAAAAPTFLHDRRRLAAAGAGMLLAVLAIYVLLPQIVGLDEAFDRLGTAVWYWLVIAVAFMVASFAAYVALFRGVLGGTSADEVRRRLDISASYQITVAGFAATRIFSAGGAAGIALTYWALRKAGMERRQGACRMVAFIVLLYALYLLALLLFGVLLRTGVLPGPSPLGGTVVPASIAGILLTAAGLIALIPGDVERRLSRLSGDHRRTGRLLGRIATGPATVATGVRTAIDYLRHPRRGALAVTGAIGYWAAQIGILWASFEAFGGDVALGVLVQGFFVGMVANLLPSPAGGVGTIDAGMIGAFLLFEQPAEVVFPAVLAYRTIAFWLPIPPGIVATFQLRRTVAEWEREGDEGYTSESKVSVEAT